MNTSDICEIIAVRHGQTVSNKSGILQGHLDIPLDEVGLQQAQAIALRLKNRHFDVAYSSDLSRAMVTGEKILEFHPDLKLIPSPELREWNLGELQGQKYSDLIVKYPEVMKAFQSPTGNLQIPGGESLDDFQLRIANFMNKTASENIGKRVLLISHGGAMQRILSHTFGQLGEGNIRPLCDNASLSVFKFKAGKWQLVTWNDISHLESVGTHSTLVY